jgi:hypothetical protein
VLLPLNLRDLAAVFVFGLLAIQIPPINARVSVVKAVEPGYLEVRVTVPPHEDNRGYRVKLTCYEDRSLDLENFKQLDGLSSEGPFHPSVFSSLLPCHYTVTAQLLGQGGVVRAHSQPHMATIHCLQCE